ncbi:right-handed parallel beta-helix repeat-containing protein [Methyloprofundus sp.]|uniref:right-handed parallel beta-helix repeat-containing protein n=1 Tax=Methyloprofundus sp. TaxID=2020875 RepID=UPI003D0AA37E
MTQGFGITVAQGKQAYSRLRNCFPCATVESKDKLDSGIIEFSLLNADMDIRLNNSQVSILPTEAKEIASKNFKSHQTRREDTKSSSQNANTPEQHIYQVGSSSMYATPSDISREVGDNSIVEIEAGEYFEDVTVWRQSNITIRGIGGRAHLKANGKAAEGKAIWVFKGNNVAIENIEFSEAKVASRNGAGIRMEGSNLTIRNCHFHDNEMGILTGKNLASEIIIENSEFNNNTVDYNRHKRLGHNIYIGEIAKFTLTGSYIHDAETGHNIKSRAHENYILYNKITDEKLGSSYLLDMPNGGDAFVVGNLFHQNTANDNYTLLSYSAERKQNKASSLLYVVNNTFVNSAQDSQFIKNHAAGLTVLVNNLFVGPGQIMQGAAVQFSNVQLAVADFVNAENYDYRLKHAMSALTNRGIVPGEARNGFILSPKYQYRHPATTELRPLNGNIDIGAYEFVP